MSHSNKNSLTQYQRKVLEADAVKVGYNILAALYSWLLLAGFVVAPGTFTSLQKAGMLGKFDAGKLVPKAVQHMPSFWIAIVCCSVGMVGLLWLWWKLKDNYVWLATKLFLYVLGRLL